MMTRHQGARRSRRLPIHQLAGVALPLLAIGLWQTMTPGLRPVVESAPASASAPAMVAAAEAPQVAAAPSDTPDPVSSPSPPSVPSGWRGHIGRPANVRVGPLRSAAPIRELVPGTPVQVLRWVAGDAIEPDNPTWAEIAPGEFVYAMLLQPDALPEAEPRGDAPTDGKWIAVDTTRQIATAYEGARPIHTTFVSTGRPGWETPSGTWHIQRRVASEIMDGGTLAGQGPGGLGATYRVEHVRWTQYFTADGSAIHENYWRDPTTFGVPGSHGCVGMPPTEAEWFWGWAESGTPVVVRTD